VRLGPRRQAARAAEFIVSTPSEKDADMIRRAFRALPLLAVALLIGALSAGSFAVADGHPNGVTGRAAASYSAWDEQWLTMSIEGDRFEIQGGTLAQKKGVTQKVRALGATLVKDHTKSLKDSTALAKKLGIHVPAKPSPTQQWQLNTVAQYTGSVFDRWYADLEVKDHMQDITEARAASTKGHDPAVRANAKAEIPTLQKHLKLAQDARTSAGGTPRR
jgi:putative membrane protein